MATWRIKTCLMGAAAACLLGSAPADAGARRAPGYAPGYVVAQSDYGNGTVSGPVRRARFGYEVRLPGGNWVDCRLDCAEALRVESIDFWETHGPNGLPGHRLLGLKWYRYY
jgi:hypothetical protein